MRILFVDDEQFVLDGVQRSLFDSDWEVETASSGVDALELFEEEIFDVIVSDMRMPGMDGEELLRKIEENYPDTVRIILSGQADQAAAIRSSFISHRWLDKPFDSEELIKVLALIEDALSCLPNAEMRRLICGISALPSPPHTYVEIQGLIQERADLEGVATIIDQDLSLASKVLQVTNSAMFSRGGQTHGVHAAVVRLGAEMISDFVLFSETYSMAASSPFLNVEEVTKESFLISRLAVEVANHFDESLAIEAKLAGLLSDIGQSVLLQAFPEKAKEYMDQISVASEEDIEQIEIDLFGLADAQVGAYLLLMWGFSAEIFNAVLVCRDYEKCLDANSTLPVIIYIARHLARDRELEQSLVSHYELEQILPVWKETAERLRAN